MGAVIFVSEENSIIFLIRTIFPKIVRLPNLIKYENFRGIRLGFAR